MRTSTSSTGAYLGKVKPRLGDVCCDAAHSPDLAFQAISQRLFVLNKDIAQSQCRIFPVRRREVEIAAHLQICVKLARSASPHHYVEESETCLRKAAGDAAIARTTALVAQSKLPNSLQGCWVTLTSTVAVPLIFPNRSPVMFGVYVSLVHLDTQAIGWKSCFPVEFWSISVGFVRTGVLVDAMHETSIG